MNQAAAAFGYPFRAGPGRWLLGCLLVLVWPLAFVPLLGYAIAALRASALDATAAPPGFRLDAGVWRDGAWTALAVGLITLPFGIAWWPLSSVLLGRVIRTGDPLFDRIYALLVAGLALALPWGLALLVQMPGASARFAFSGRGRDLFDLGASLRGIRDRYGAWNLAVAAIVSGWFAGILAGALCCVGIVPGAFYAILVSAHASATLASPNQPPR